jgi:hypothetical protein
MSKRATRLNSDSPILNEKFVCEKYNKTAAHAQTFWTKDSDYFVNIKVTPADVCFLSLVVEQILTRSKQLAEIHIGHRTTYHIDHWPKRHNDVINGK